MGNVLEGIIPKHDKRRINITNTEERHAGAPKEEILAAAMWTEDQMEDDTQW